MTRSKSTEPPYVDRARTIRSGESLDLERLEDYLREVMPEWHGPLVLKQFPSGHSNLTYLLELGGREVVLRRPPFGANIKSAHDMGREYRILSKLVTVFDKVPKPLHHCEDTTVIGGEFYLMERVHGVILRQRKPEGLELTPALMRTLSETLVDTLVELHGVDYEACGLATFGKPEGYVERQVRGWTRRYERAKTDSIPEMERVAVWINAHMPADSGAAVIHNDFKYDNLVLGADDITRVVAILDWEMATLGDPLMDLGSTLGYWIEENDPMELRALPFGLTHLPGNLTRQQIVERYADASGRDLTHVLFYYAYALFKIAVIVQQIYKRFHDGHTQDERFAMFIHAVRLLAAQATRAIDAGRIHQLG